MKFLLALLWCINQAERLSERIHPAFAPLWRAWSWLTGWSTHGLARWLLAVFFGAGVVATGPTGDWLGLAIHLGLCWYVGSLMRHVRRDSPSEVLSIQGALARSSLMSMAGIGGVLVIVIAIPTADWWGVARMLCLIVAMHAAVADQPGGSSCLRRAADALGSLGSSRLGWAQS